MSVPGAMQACKLLLAALIVTAVAIRVAHYCDKGAGGPSRSEAVSKIPSKSLEGVKLKATHRLAFAVRQANVKLNFVSYSLIRRFDFKQNLRLWPILVNDLERSPPHSVAV
jgi:hypothetical protein